MSAGCYLDAGVRTTPSHPVDVSWGNSRSAGHCLDLSGAVLGLTPLPIVIVGLLEAFWLSGEPDQSGAELRIYRPRLMNTPDRAASR